MIKKNININNDFASDDRRETECKQDRTKPDGLNQWLDHIQLDERIERKMDQAEENILMDIHRRMDSEGSRRSKRGFHFRYFAVVASLVVVVVLSGFFLLGIGEQNVEYQLVTVNTPRGMQTELVLPDGSKVWLNGGSTISYPEKFEDNSRDVILNGEAYFDVKSDSKWPFMVHSGEMELKVLGTTFNVEAYEDDNFMNVTLETGKVSMHFADQANDIILHPNQQLTYNRLTRETQMLDVDASKITAWSDGKLYFTAMPLKQITTKLQRYYDVNFSFASDEIANIVYTIEFVGNESIDEILTIWSMDRRLNFKKENDKIIITE